MAPDRMFAAAKVIPGGLPHCYCVYAPNMVENLDRDGCTANLGYSSTNKEYYLACHLYDPANRRGEGPQTCGYNGEYFIFDHPITLLLSYSLFQRRPPSPGR